VFDPEGNLIAIEGFISDVSRLGRLEAQTRMHEQPGHQRELPRASGE
jgi:hypothetical protein